MLSNIKDKKNICIIFSIYLVLLSIPFSGTFNSISIILLGIVWISQKHYKNISTLINFNFFSFLIFYALFFLGLFYTEDLKNGFFQIEQKLSLLVFPLIFSTLPKIDEVKTKSIFVIFAWLCFFLSLYCLFTGLKANYSLNGFIYIDLNYITNQNLASYIGSHSTYFSIYIAFSIFIVFDILKKKNNNYKMVFIYLIILLFLTLFLFLLASRIVVLTFLILCIVYMVSFFYKKQHNKLVVITSIIILSVLISLFSQNHYFKSRLSQMYNFNMNDLIGSNNENGITQRIFFWKNSIAIIKNSPIIGYGTGDVNIELKKKYTKVLSENINHPSSVVNAINYFVNNNYNTHNQFLQILIMFGVVGLIVFLVILTISYYKAVKTKKLLYFSFLTLIALSCFTECVLERQIGVVFFSFFNSLFLFFSSSKPEKPNDISAQNT